jgi:hypothetical protein
MVTSRTLFSGKRTPTQGVDEVRATLETRPGLRRHALAEA